MLDALIIIQKWPWHVRSKGQNQEDGILDAEG